MIRHFLRLSWNRKSGQFLLGLELLVCFILITAVTTSAFSDYFNFRRPLGFNVKEVWNLEFHPSTHSGEFTPADSSTMQQVMLTLKSLSEVVALSENSHPTLTGGVSSSRLELPGQPSQQCYHTEVSADLGRVMRLDIVRGRWFDKADFLATNPGFVINERLARAMHGDEDPIGKPFIERNNRNLGTIIGVISDYRQFDIFEDPHWFRFDLVRLDRPIVEGIPTSFMIRLEAGTPRQFERVLREKMNAAAPGWYLRLNSLEEAYETQMQHARDKYSRWGGLAAGIVVLVALSLVGVLWQTITERTREIGVRRAVGASAFGVYAQFVGETLVLTTIALGAGGILVAQAAILGFYPEFSSGTYFAGAAAAAFALYLIVTLATADPAWLATRVRPVEALHWE